MTETITGSYTWETRREYHRTLNFVIKFAGTETNVSFTKDGTPTSKVTECIAPTYCEFGIFNAAVNWFPPLISEYSCTINGASVPCDTDIIVSMITKNILEVYDEAGIVAKLITPDGVTKTLSTPISANQATYDPGSASITVSTTDTICYV